MRSKENTIKKILKAKYFSVMFDCTSDSSHEEQMTVIIRCMDIEDTDGVKVEQFFLGFIIVDETSGLGLFKQLENILYYSNLTWVIYWGKVMTIDVI